VLAAIERGETIYIPEGEKDANTVIRTLGLTATTNAMGVGKWQDRYSETLTGADCVLLPDNDKAGRNHMRQVAASLQGKAAGIRVLELPGLPEKGDVSDWVAAGGTREQLVILVQQTPIWTPVQRPPTCWDKAVPIGEFLAQQDVEYEAYIRDFVVPGAITIVAAPRGTGKSITALSMGISLANGGRFRLEAITRRRVLVIDRDNPAKIVRARLRKLGAKAGSTLDILTRENAPPLSEKAAWASFPIEKYDVVIIDSLGSSTEGISEREGKQTQEFLATLKDLAHRGPAILALDNTNKAATSYRGRGEKADAVDILFECRDITGWTPPASADWWEHLPEYGDHAWQSRASRRQGQVVLRIAFIPSKYRLGIEPSPFALEIDTRTDPWTLADITNALAVQGEEAAREHRDAERIKMESAAEALCSLIEARPHDDPLRQVEAVQFLQTQRITLRQARNMLKEGFNADIHKDEGRWVLRSIPGGKAHALGVYLAE
jgi:hypothetical protein